MKKEFVLYYVDEVVGINRIFKKDTPVGKVYTEGGLIWVTLNKYPRTKFLCKAVDSAKEKK